MTQTALHPLKSICQNSYRSPDESTLIKFLDFCDIQDFLQEDDTDDEDDCDSPWMGKAIRDEIANGSPRAERIDLDGVFELLEENLNDFAETIASVGYDLYGPGASGYNEVVRICGWYWIRGSDYIEGPTEDPKPLISFLRFTDEKGYDCWIEKEYEHLLSHW